MKKLDTVTYAVEGQVAIITLNRPERMNTLGGSMKPDLACAFFEWARADPQVRCVVLTGAGERAFCAGADIKERAASTPPPADYFVNQQRTHELFSGIASFEKPVIAALNGVALGGGLELALCADMRYAADHARLGLPEVKLGVIPAAGGTQRLTRVVGAAKAKELVFTSALIPAAEGLALGLVNRVVPAASLMEETMALARSIAAQPPLAVRFAKQAIDLGQQVDIHSALQYERFSAAMIVDSEDRKEGMRAFVEKRAPRFQGR
ncbi:crotonase [Verticiella sediminum]|uniref:Crotonase n=1 Tax=Verticiella sediminum TaxID=1247510 RepID=A0A556AWL9_9BURK|nr:enoyl-CoA hydratase-related protein [Verticiella sediminum]TSH97320.1 crotonase [Verticiella sediminum]